jgi:hypothetical protein
VWECDVETCSLIWSDFTASSLIHVRITVVADVTPESGPPDLFVDSIVDGEKQWFHT